MKQNQSKSNYYHLAKLITKIDEIKLIENITVEKRHDLITRWLTGCGRRDSDNDVVELLIDELSNDVGRRSIDVFLLSRSWSPSNEKWISRHI